jgi:hypothetical protein
MTGLPVAKTSLTNLGQSMTTIMTYATEMEVSFSHIQLVSWVPEE